MIERFVSSLLDVVFPRRCLLCQGWEGLDSGDLCLTCAGQIDNERREPGCPACGTSVAPYEVSRERCGECRRRPTRLMGTIRVGPYGPALGALVRAYKYNGREQLEPLLGGWLADAAQAASWVPRVEAVVSVPTHWKRRLYRPFYPPERLASIVARRIHLPHLPVLQRIRGGPHQIGLSYTARVANVSGAFAIGKGITLHGARLLLVDDVKTTGATLEECAKVLRNGGAAEVYGAVLARAGGDRRGIHPPASI